MKDKRELKVKDDQKKIFTSVQKHIFTFGQSSFRSRLWAEPCLLSCAVKKLGGSVERWLGVAEDLFGPYLWGR